MNRFQYVLVSKGFLESLCEKVRNGESVVVLGPRHGGKRYTLDRIAALLSDNPVGPIVRLRFMTELPLRHEGSVRKVICDAAVSAGASDDYSTDEDLFTPIDNLSKRTGKPVILLAANVDAMPHHLARRFLLGAQYRVLNKRLIVVLTSESDFRDFVHGPGSEFNCADPYVLQGFAEDEFRSLMYGYATALRMHLEWTKDEFHRLWELTGGSVCALRSLLAGVPEFREPQEVEKAAGTQIRAGQFPELRGIPGVYWVHAFRHTTQVIDRDPASWDGLERLIAGEKLPLALDEAPPGTLELSGIAVRRGGFLEFSSPLMKEFIERRFDDLHFGDLHARSGEWEKAFARYRRLNSDERLRPVDVEDRGEVERVVHDLSAALHSEAPQGTSRVMRLFGEGCRFVLGFRQVVFWKRDKTWVPLDAEEYGPLPLPPAHLSDILPVGQPASPDWLPVPAPWEEKAAAMLLDSPRPGETWAITVSDEGSVISRERERLLRYLFRHFREAQRHSVQIEKDRARLEIRDKHVSILNSILGALGSKAVNPGTVLAMAARGLRTLGYRRVLFCLVDPVEKRIRGVLDDSDDPAVDVAKMTDWGIDKPLADLQPYVVHTAQPRIIEDAAREPLANQDVVRRAGLTSFAIVPMFDLSESVVGTIHVERADRAVPTREEVEDLIAFGRQLTVAFEQSERVTLLQFGLDRVPEPVLIFDKLEQCRYANEPATRLFPLTLGWRDRNDAQTLSGPGTEDVASHVRQSLVGQRVFYHFKGIGSDSTYRGALLCERILDWQNRVIGSLVRIEDMNYLSLVLEAFRKVAGASDTDSAMNAALEAAQLLGHSFGRLYLIDEDDRDTFIGKRSFGFSNEEHKRRFERGEVRLPRREEHAYETWLSIEQRSPLVFCWVPEMESGQEIVTAHGLKALSVKAPQCLWDLEKEAGQFWIDIPLLTPQRELGKLTLECGEGLGPEHFEMLKILTNMASDLLEAFLRRDREAADRKRLVQRTAERSLSVIGHNVLTQIGSFSPLLSLYRDAEKKSTELKELNDIFEDAFKRVHTTLNRVKDMLTAVVPKPQPFDLLARLKAVALSALPDGSWSVDCAAEMVELTGDANLLEGALLELLKNSREMVAGSNNLHVRIVVDEVKRSYEDTIRIVYEDNGPGIPAAEKDRIFEEFYSRRPGGKASTGLGLSYVRRVIDAHGGTVWAVAEPGSDARFVIEVPRTARPKEEAAQWPVF